ncbi:MAG: MarR family transcriptional regulator [Dehalococcoidia bacterium]|nr:MarR family transcriptional regulator [Dehalococcoidia bacterium]
MAEEVSLDDYRALHEFRYAIRLFLRFSEDAARAAGVEPQQHQLMLAIKGMPEGETPNMAALAERLQLRHHSVVELVDRLAAHGYVERARGEADRRQVIVHLTPAGERALHDLSVNHRAQLRKAGPALVRVLEELTRGGESLEAAQEALAHETRVGA